MHQGGAAVDRLRRLGRDEVADVVAAAGGCRPEDDRVGTLRAMANGLYSAWVQCPLGAAVKASQVGKLRIGWTVARVELLKARPTLCYRCWGRGHVKAQCKAVVDRSRTCYRCRVEGHNAIGCLAPVSCVVCKEGGKDHQHRVGSQTCTLSGGHGEGVVSSRLQSQAPGGEEAASRLRSQTPGNMMEKVRRALEMVCDSDA